MSSAIAISSDLPTVSATEHEKRLVRSFTSDLVSILREYYGTTISSKHVAKKDKLSLCSHGGKGLCGNDLNTIMAYFDHVGSKRGQTAVKIKMNVSVKLQMYRNIVGRNDVTLSGLIAYARSFRDDLDKDKKGFLFFKSSKAIIGYLNNLIRTANHHNAEIAKERDVALLDRTVALDAAKSDVRNLVAELEGASTNIEAYRLEIEGLSAENLDQQKVITFLSETLNTVTALLKKAQETASYEEGAKQAAHINKQIVDLQMIRNSMMEQLTLIEGHLLSIRTQLETVGNGLKAIHAGIEMRNEEITFTFESARQGMARLGQEFAHRKQITSNVEQQRNVKFHVSLILTVCKDINIEIAAYRQRIKKQWFSGLRKGGRKLRKLEELATITKQVVSGLRGEELELSLPYKMYKRLEAQTVAIIGSFGDDSLAGGECLTCTNRIEKSVDRLGTIHELKTSAALSDLESEHATETQRLLYQTGERVLETGSQEMSALSHTEERLASAHVAVEDARCAISEVLQTAIPGSKTDGFTEQSAPAVLPRVVLARSVRLCSKTALAAIPAMYRIHAGATASSDVEGHAISE